MQRAELMLCCVQGALIHNGTTERVVLKRVKSRVEVRLKTMFIRRMQCLWLSCSLLFASFPGL
jgi:hypothetical protein